MKPYLLFGITILFAVGCAVVRQDIAANTAPPVMASLSPTPQPYPKSIGDINFEKKWKDKYESTLAQLEHNRRLWQTKGILNYDFVAAKYAGGVTNPWDRSPVIIKVRDGAKTSIELKDKSSQAYMNRLDGFEEIDNIDKLFDYLRSELASGKILENKYDKKSGYPKIAVIGDSWQIHGSRSIQLSKLEAVK